MRFFSCTADGAAQWTNQRANLRRLVASRWIVLAVMAVLTAGAPGLLAIPLPQAPLFAVLGVTAAFNALADRRLRRASHATSGELLSQLLLDIAALSALMFFSGGATNPLISLLLPPLAFAALTLPIPCVLAAGAIAIAAYSLLLVVYVPLPMPDAARATQLHLIGMWLTFAVSAAMIAWFVVRLTGLIRQRDAELAAAREQALRDERVLAMGTLAAGAAHELGTPLATMSLLAGELATDASLPAAVHEDIALLRRQIAVCKEIITGLSRRAGTERLDSPPLQPADRWLDNLRQHWHAIRPQAASRLIIGSDGPAPELVADPRLEQALLNLFNNAANATPQPLEIRLAWGSDDLCIDIRDGGPGFPPAVLQNAGQHGLPAHAGGSGVGLLLTRTAIEQLGGKLNLSNPDEGGALARIELPRVDHDCAHA
ncbi:MAG: sensor histidine kinase [Azonexus sp.]|uniref:ATP-binding protein n=1 Tax=Azonexus sp. TaxID=1872668 RepID=UPI002817C7C2|nr:ATP-binding protein [Azonexus sp.]MDR0776180.1 sensor histidine kinase [Azonexus sp.]